MQINEKSRATMWPKPLHLCMATPECTTPAHIGTYLGLLIGRTVHREKTWFNCDWRCLLLGVVVVRTTNGSRRRTNAAVLVFLTPVVVAGLEIACTYLHRRRY
jgi:hypothetical protein